MHKVFHLVHQTKMMAVGIDIGKLLAGGVAVAVAAGVGIAGYKSGQKLSAFKKDDGVLTTAWNGIKSWFGKNGDDVAQVSAECKTSLKTLFSGGEISQTQKQDIVENADEISKVFSNKAGKNATKYDELTQIVQKGNDDEKKQALAKFLKVNGELTLDGNTLKAASTEDQAIIARKLKNTDGNSITGNSIDEIINGLKIKYKTKHENYDTAVGKIKDIRVKDIREDSDVFKDTTIAKRLNRAGAAQTLAGSCEDPSSYINTQNSLTKWLKAGDLTQDEYDNLRAYAEQKFMSAKDDGYLNYLKQTLKKAGGSEINFNSLDKESINLLNNKFKGLKLTENTKLNINDLLNWKKENTKSISEYLGLNDCLLSSKKANGFKLVNGDLVWEASAGRGKAPTEIFGKEIGITKYEITKKGETTTKIKLTMKNIKEILNPSVPPTPTPPPTTTLTLTPTPTTLTPTTLTPTPTPTPTPTTI